MNILKYIRLLFRKNRKVDFHLQNRFLKMMWKYLSVKKNSLFFYYNLSEYYDEPHRYYFTLSQHVNNCLRELDSVRQLVFDHTIVEFALWYYKAVCFPEAKDNTEKSLELAFEVMGEAKLPQKFQSAVENLILVANHETMPISVEEQIIFDIDLAIFGQKEIIYGEYEKKLRREYEYLTDEQYAFERSEKLRAIFEKSKIYQTLFFRSKYEVRARANIKNTLLSLEAEFQY